MKWAVVALSVVVGLLFVCMLFCVVFGALGFVLDRSDWEAQAARITTTERAQVVTDVVGQDAEQAQRTEPAEGSFCRPNVWMEEALQDTGDVATLISVLNRDFDLRDGGQWSEPGYVVPAESVFWTDLFQNASSLPSGVSTVRRQGGWGVYFTSEEYPIPGPNGGGRWMRLCTSLVSEAEAVVSAGEPANVDAECVFPVLAGKTAAEAVNAMDKWYDNVGYQFGSAFSSGDVIPPESIFWTDMGEGFSVPAHVNCLKCSGNWGVFQTTAQAFQPPSGGRFAVCPR